VADTTDIADILRKKWFGDWNPDQPTYSGTSQVGPSVSLPKTSVSDGSRTMQATSTPATPAATPAPTYAPTGIDQYGDFDPTYDQAMNQYTAQENSANSAYTQGLNQLQGQYDVPMMQLAQQRGDDLDMLAARMAQQGILRSSNNLWGQGKLENAYQTEVGNMTSQIQQGEEGLSRQRQSILDQILQGRNQAASSHTQFLQGKEQARAQAAAEAAAAAEAQRKQDELNAQLQAQRDAAAKAYNDQHAPTPTGQIPPAPAPTPPPAPNWGGAGEFTSPGMSFDSPQADTAGTWNDPRYSWSPTIAAAPPPAPAPPPPPPPAPAPAPAPSFVQWNADPWAPQPADPWADLWQRYSW
jgi:hypothetical protein